MWFVKTFADFESAFVGRSNLRNERLRYVCVLNTGEEERERERERERKMRGGGVPAHATVAGFASIGGHVDVVVVVVVVVTAPALYSLPRMYQRTHP